MWLHPARNSPEQLPRIGETFAGLRAMPVEAAAQLTTRNALDVLPRLARLI
jgi:TatD DNase family protein